MFLITGTLQGKTETLDTCDKLSTARKLRDEYRLAFGNAWTIAINLA